MGQVDRLWRSRVCTRAMHFSRVAMCALALTVGSACGGASPDPVEPVAGAGGDPTRPEDMGPEMGDNVTEEQLGEGTDPDDPTAGTDEPGDEADPGAGDEPAAEPEIKPPGLDLSPEEKSRQVAEHLERGEAALAGDSPKPKAAISAAKAALEVDQTSIEAMVLLAHAYYVQGNYQKCEAVLDIAKARPGGAQNPELHFLYGLIYARSERDDEAMAAYKQAVTLDPSYRHGLLNYGVYLIDNKRWDDAIRVYEKLTGQLGMRTAAALNNLATAYRGKSAQLSGPAGNPQQRAAFLLKAKATYDQALKLDPGYARVYYNLGVLYLDAQPFPAQGGEMDTLKRLETAITYFEKYQALPGANDKLAAEHKAVAQKLYDREKKIREYRKKQEERRRARGG